MKKYNLVHWNRHFREYITSKIYQHFSIPQNVTIKDILKDDKYPEVKRIFQKLPKSRLDMAKAGLILVHLSIERLTNNMCSIHQHIH